MILALETATPRSSVALVEGGAVVAEASLPEGRQASETVLSAVSGLLAACGVAPTDISCVAVSAGPGSFTGLRVGMASAKGFCYGWNLPLARVATLAALAFRLPSERRTLCPVLDARKKEVYAAFFRWDGEALARVTPDLAVLPEELLGRLPDGDIVFFGDGVSRYRERFRARSGARGTVFEGPEAVPSAAAVGVLGERIFLSGGAADPRSAIPSYIRPSEAEFRRLFP